jgi:uncharacterized membrane protein
MVEQTPAGTPGEAVSMMVLPHRSLSRAGLWLFLALQGMAVGGFALLAAVGGNVFAPAFAVLELVAVVYCLHRVWRYSAVGELIIVSPSRLEIAQMGAAAPAVRFHPYWAQVQLQPGNWRGAPSRLLVRSHGREVEIGAFLNDAERRDLAARLDALRAQALAYNAQEQDRAPRGPTNFDAR